MNNAERKRCIIAPSYFEPNKDDFQITIFSINYPSKFVQLSIRMYLGALLSLGIDRSKFGDIRVAENTVQFAVATEVADYVRANLTGIGKVKVHVEEVSDRDASYPNGRRMGRKFLYGFIHAIRCCTCYDVKYFTTKIQSLIAAGKVKVNWTVRESTSFELQEGDILSARGFGRLKVIMIEGRTKKDKIRLQIGRLEQKS